MTSDHPISAGRLTEADLQSHPIWRFLTDAEGRDDVDESHVVPSNEALATGTHGSYLVAASFRLGNGARLPGAVQVDVLGPKVYFTPAVIHARGKAVDALARDAEKRLSRITQASNTRPVQWELAVVFRGERQARRGRMAGSSWVAALALLVRLVVMRFSRRRP